MNSFYELMERLGAPGSRPLFDERYIQAAVFEPTEAQKRMWNYGFGADIIVFDEIAEDDGA